MIRARYPKEPVTTVHTFRSVSPVNRAVRSRYSVDGIPPDWANAKESLTRLKRSMGAMRATAAKSLLSSGAA